MSEGSSRVMSLWAINTLLRMIRDIDVSQDRIQNLLYMSVEVVYRHLTAQQALNGSAVDSRLVKCQE